MTEFPRLYGEIAPILSNAGFFVKPGYATGEDNLYFSDTLQTKFDVVHQPQIYPLAAFLAERYGCRTIVDIGCGRAGKLVELADQFEIIGIDFQDNIKFCKSNYGFGTWLEVDLEKPAALPLSEQTLHGSLIICSDVIEHLVNPTPLLINLNQALTMARVAVISTPERDLVRGFNNCGPPANRHHVREWNLAEFRQLLEATGLNLHFLGLTENNDRDRAKRTMCALAGSQNLPLAEPAPADFKVQAFVTAYNEADILEPCVKHLLAQGVQVHLIDNWSTDETWQVASRLAEDSRVTMEQFPPEGPQPAYQWQRLLSRVDNLATASQADWCIHNDADELRQAPWPSLSLRDAFYCVERAGFNAVDHTILNFPPVEDIIYSGENFDRAFSGFRFGTNPGHFVQIKAWKNTGTGVNLAGFGGHKANFEGQKIFPYKFLSRHYPFRSQEHGLRKVLLDRKPRFSEEWQTLGWHTHYDHITVQHKFSEAPENLIVFDLDTIYTEYLVEAISGIGIPRIRPQTGEVVRG